MSTLRGPYPSESKVDVLQIKQGRIAGVALGRGMGGDGVKGSGRIQLDIEIAVWLRVFDILHKFPIAVYPDINLPGAVDLRAVQAVGLQIKSERIAVFDFRVKLHHGAGSIVSEMVVLLGPCPDKFLNGRALNASLTVRVENNPSVRHILVYGQNTLRVEVVYLAVDFLKIHIPLAVENVILLPIFGMPAIFQNLAFGDGLRFAGQPIAALRAFREGGRHGIHVAAIGKHGLRREQSSHKENNGDQPGKNENAEKLTVFSVCLPWSTMTMVRTVMR